MCNNYAYPKPAWIGTLGNSFFDYSSAGTAHAFWGEVNRKSTLVDLNFWFGLIVCRGCVRNTKFRGLALDFVFPLVVEALSEKRGTNFCL